MVVGPQLCLPDRVPHHNHPAFLICPCHRAGTSLNRVWWLPRLAPGKSLNSVSEDNLTFEERGLWSYTQPSPVNEKRDPGQLKGE